MKQWIYIILLFIINPAMAQFVPTASQATSPSGTISGLITYASATGIGADGYVTTIWANTNIPAPKIKYNDYNITFYPNPVTNLLTVKLIAQKQINSISAKVFDLNGKILTVSSNLQTVNNKALIRLNLTDLSPGIYLLKLYINNKTLSIKIIKN